MSISVWTRISPFWREDFDLSLSLHLILLNMLMLVNTIHELVHTTSGFNGQ